MLVNGRGFLSSRLSGRRQEQTRGTRPYQHQLEAARHAGPRPPLRADTETEIPKAASASRETSVLQVGKHLFARPHGIRTRGQTYESGVQATPAAAGSRNCSTMLRAISRSPMTMKLAPRLRR